MAHELPSGVTYDEDRRVLRISRGPGNTLLCLGLGGALLGAELIAAVNVVDPDMGAGQRFLLGAAMVLGGLLAGWFVLTLWRMGWSIHDGGITIRAGNDRTIRWEEVESLRLLTRAGAGDQSGPRAYVVVERRAESSDSTPTRPSAAGLRAVLEFARGQDLIPEHVSIRAR